MSKPRATKYKSQFNCVFRAAVWLFLVVAFSGSIFPVAADELNDTNRVSERYLLIIDTSASMRRNAENLRATLGNLFQSEMNGQFKEGDTIGVWTFNESLQTGLLPLQTWSPETSQTVVTNMDAFLRGLRYEKGSKPETVIPQMKSVAGGSERITLMIFTAGDVPIVGTPLDRQINYAFQNSRAELQKSRTPFVIVMRVQRGKYVGGSVTWSPWPIDFPEFPPLPKPKEPVPTKPAATNAAPAVKSLIVIGKKPEPVTPASSGEEKVDAPAVVVVEPAQSQPPAAAPQPGNATALVKAGPPAVAKPEGPSPESPSVVTSGTVSAPVVVEPAALSETAAVPASASPAQAVLATADGAASGRNIYLIAGLLTLLLGVGLAVFLMRRQRTVSSGSLITRSMDRKD